MSDAATASGGKPKLYRVAFDLPEETAAWAPASVERLWVEKTATRMEVQVRKGVRLRGWEFHGTHHYQD